MLGILIVQKSGVFCRAQKPVSFLTLTKARAIPAVSLLEPNRRSGGGQLNCGAEKSCIDRPHSRASTTCKCSSICARTVFGCNRLFPLGIVKLSRDLNSAAEFSSSAFNCRSGLRKTRILLTVGVAANTPFTSENPDGSFAVVPH
ncbi:hypothetical protein N657DRAFT_328274 [Parathielavia appendiculata]|uniref:Uncharacterized protein n=1 Tax=Parathielavia appendiculata TaxID=2587402 RepID=A0AAN6YYG4_9PEZI|nr:hypothetical protein N657DRAFT_328274 [Parathielavia appendiculata]